MEPHYQLNSLSDKFKVLDACFKDFEHCVPNSQFHELKTVGKYSTDHSIGNIVFINTFIVGDVIKFYEKSVSSTAPFDSLVKMKLPENLHIQYNYVRFNPENDTKFNGQTAFPKSSTLVTGLKYRDKYDGFEAKRSWP